MVSSNPMQMARTFLRHISAKTTHELKARAFGALQKHTLPVALRGKKFNLGAAETTPRHHKQPEIF